ncbi:prepilin peptidase-dependent protein [Kosakonia cowanii]|uniref:prepilin peptidase-dependent protein n=1 Tax=Kosakonia cowanii TaxID=208223 RepID=UPI0039A70C96
MLNAQRGFSLLETLLAMAIGSVLLLASARFLPGLQIALMQHTRLQTIEDDLWQRLRAVAKHLQRAGYCNGSCNGQPLFISAKGECVIAQWDANSNGRWESAPNHEAEQTAFRLQNGALETLRGATSCTGRGWEKVTDPAQMHVERFSVTQRQTAGLSTQLTIQLAASLPGAAEKTVSGELTVTGYNL